jgi:hypothetical protein
MTKYSEGLFIFQLNNCTIYIPSVHLTPKGWVQLLLNTSHVDSLKWRSRDYKLQLSQISASHNYQTITRVRTVQRYVIGLPKQERRTDHSQY